MSSCGRGRGHAGLLGAGPGASADWRGISTSAAPTLPGVVHHATRCHDVELLLAAAHLSGRPPGLRRRRAPASGAARRGRAAPRRPAPDRRPRRPAHDAGQFALPSEPLRCLDGGRDRGRRRSRPASTTRQLARGRPHRFARTSLWAVGPDPSAGCDRAARSPCSATDGDPELRPSPMPTSPEPSRAGDSRLGGPGQPGGACGHAEAALASCPPLDRPEVRGHALMYRGSAPLAMGEADRCERPERRPSEILQSFPRTELGVRVCVNVSGSAYRAGQFDQAESYVEHGLQLAKGSEFFSGEYRLALRPEPRCGSAAAIGPRPSASCARCSPPTASPASWSPLATCLLARVPARQGRPRRVPLCRRRSLAAARREHRRTPRLGPGRHRRGRVRAGWRGQLPATGTGWPSPTTWPTPCCDAPAPAATTRSPPSSPATCAGRASTTRPRPAAPEPWASGLRGDCAAAAEWRRRGEPTRKRSS